MAAPQAMATMPMTTTPVRLAPEGRGRIGPATTTRSPQSIHSAPDRRPIKRLLRIPEGLGTGGGPGSVTTLRGRRSWPPSGESGPGAKSRLGGAEKHRAGTAAGGGRAYRAAAGRGRADSAVDR